MALPILPSTQMFADDQQHVFRAKYWDTTATAVFLGDEYPTALQGTAAGTGVGFRLFDLNVPTFSPTSKVQLDAA